MKTIIVSNRLPLHIRIKDKTIETVPSVGGLATGIKSIQDENNTLWVGWNGLAEDDVPCDHIKDEIVDAVIKEDCIPVALSHYDLQNYYNAFCNRTLWPLFHYFTEYVHFSKKSWESYKEVNRKFAEEVLTYAENDDLVWVHDFHLMLVPQYIKEKRPDLSVGFFLHIPFPVYEIFRILPCRTDLLKGVLAADLIGFHTHDYQRYFLKTVSRLMDVEIQCNEINFQQHTVLTGCFPMGIDVEKFESFNLKDQREEERSSLQKELEEYKKQHPDVTLVLSIDRMDYTKGIPQRIKAFSYFLKNHPEYREKVRLLMLAVPSRSGVPQYQQLKKEVDELVGNINGHFGTIGWSPIWYFYRELPFADLVDLYRNCPIALLTPIRDGMNLVAKEFLAARKDNTGVLILSEMAGAAKELGEAILINPNNFEEVAQAVSTAMAMPKHEQKQRNSLMRKKLKKQNVHQWSKLFLKTLAQAEHPEARAKYLDNIEFMKLETRYKQARNCVFLLDYDGTLVDFQNRPEDAYPDPDLIDIIKKIASYPKNNVVIISGRDKHTLGNWFKNLRVNLIAEHGTYLRECYRYDWCATGNLQQDWMESTKQLMEQFVDRTPGSFIEEKSYSLAWHYRMASGKMGKTHATELFSILHELSEQQNLKVIHGNKVIEVVNSEVNKGAAAQRFLAERQADLVIAIGDDKTDEYMFKTLRKNSFTIKVGTGPTQACYYVKNIQEVRRLLRKFIAISRQLTVSHSRKNENLPAASGTKRAVNA